MPLSGPRNDVPYRSDMDIERYDRRGCETLRTDPKKSTKLLYDPAYPELARTFHERLYSTMEKLGGL